MSDKPISDASVEALLADLAVPAARSPNPVAKWLEVEGYYPGTTPISASDLYARFLEWNRVHIDSIGKLVNFGEAAREFANRLPKKRRSAGNYYYISRKEVPHIPDDIQWRKD